MNQLPYKCGIDALVYLSLQDKRERDRITAEEAKREKLVRGERILTPEAIMEDICQVFNQKPEKVLSRSRIPELIVCKTLACYLACEKTNFSHRAIGAEYGLDRTTVMYHRDLVRDFLKVGDSEFSTLWKYFRYNSKLFLKSDFQ